MTTHSTRLEGGGFVPFYRSYTKTWIHAVATAGLTAFGTLTIVHRWFAALALASYVVPPIVLYLRRSQGRPREAEAPAEAESTNGDERERSSAGSPDRASTDAGEHTGASGTNRADSRAAPEAAECAVGAATRGRDEPTDEISRESDAPDTDDRRDDDSTDDASTDEKRRPDWHVVDAPAAATLHDVAVAGPSRACAVGAAGTVLARDGDGWTVALEDGPAARKNDLHGVDATAEGEVVWVAGDGGSLGRIDLETGRHVDYTAPEDVTDNWLGVAVGGSGGRETVLLINGSGAVLRGEYHDGALEWTGPDKPGGGSSFSGVSLRADGVGHCCDTNDGVYETTDGGASFERVGLEGADGTLTDVATAGRGDCLVSADDGVVHRYDGPTWTPERVADETLTGVARRDERAAACAADGTVSEREGSSGEWEAFDTGASSELQAIAVGPERAVAVGADGTVVERT